MSFMCCFKFSCVLMIVLLNVGREEMAITALEIFTSLRNISCWIMSN